MFKKTLLAASLAAMSTAALAVDVDSSSTYTYGYEALASGAVANDFTVLDLNAVVLTLAAEYSVGDIIKINISGGTFDTRDTFGLTASGTLGDLTVGFLSATANELVFRVTAVQNTATTGKTLTLAAGSDVKLDDTSIGAKVTISASAETSTGIAIDVAGTKDSKVVGTVIQQHKFAVTSANKLDEKIDVSDERKALTAASDTATVTYTYTAPTFAGSDFDVTAGTGLKLTVNGSYVGFEKGLTGSTNVGVITLDGTDSTVAADLQSGSASVARPAASDTLPVVFTPDTGATTRKVLSVSSYTVDARLTSGADSVTYTGTGLGSLVLNGSSAQYAYAPVGFDTVTTQFEIGNAGVVDGEITITAFDTDGNDYEAMLPFKAEAGKLTRVADSDIATAFGLTKGTKLNLTFTVNAPNADITYAGYSNRGTTGRMAINKL